MYDLLNVFLGHNNIMAQQQSERRRFFRYRSLLLSLEPLVLIDHQPEANTFQPTIAGLIVDESDEGFGFVTSSTLPSHEDDVIKVEVGGLPPREAKVCWKRTLDDDLIRIGIKYLMAS